MRKPIHSRLLALSLIMYGASVAAQEGEQIYRLDLADDNDVSLMVEPGTIARFRIINFLPSKNYRIRVSRSQISPPAFDSSLLLTALNNMDCQKLVDDITTAKTEADLAEKIRAAEAGVEMCTGPDKTVVMNAILSTKKDVQARYTISSRDRITLIVERVNDKGDEIEETWKLELSGGGPGQWSVRYGFNFIPNQDDRFFSAENSDEPGTYTIKKQADREELDFAPSIFFAWRSAESSHRSGPVFGLGFNLDEPLVFGGWGFDFGDNVTLALGGVFQKQSRLGGRYSDGQQLTTSLDESQLSEETYNLNAFIGIAFRFDRSPFGGDDE